MMSLSWKIHRADDFRDMYRRVRPPLAPFPPLVKTLRDKRSDLVTDVRVTLGFPRSESVITYVWKEAAGKRKMERESSGKGREACK